MAKFSVLLDACVLVPFTLADTLLRQAEADLYRPLWSRKILEEVQSAVERVHPDLEEEFVRRRIAGMERAFPDARVAGWEPLVAALDLPDPDDRHVLAAAIRGRADLIVTNNLKDFPATALEVWEIEVQSADEFLLNQLDLYPEEVTNALERQALATKKPPLTLLQILEGLKRCDVGRFADAARERLNRDVPPPSPATFAPPLFEW